MSVEKMKIVGQLFCLVVEEINAIRKAYIASSVVPEERTYIIEAAFATSILYNLSELVLAFSRVIFHHKTSYIVLTIARS
jgi:hypothetical protein